MTKNEALTWLRQKCPPEFYKTLEYFLLEDLICLIYDDGKEIVDRIIHVEDGNCTTPHCKGKVTKHKKLKVCVKCYRKSYYDKNFRSLKRLAQEREGVADEMA